DFLWTESPDELRYLARACPSRVEENVLADVGSQERVVCVDLLARVGSDKRDFRILASGRDELCGQRPRRARPGMRHDRQIELPRCCEDHISAWRGRPAPMVKRMELHGHEAQLLDAATGFCYDLSFAHCR